MTRTQAMQEVDTILDDIIDRGIEAHFGSHDHDVGEKAAMRRDLNAWKEEKLREIELELDAMVRSMLN